MVINAMVTAVQGMGPDLLNLMGPYESVGPLYYNKNGLVVTTRPDTLLTQDRVGMFIQASSQISTDTNLIYNDTMPGRAETAPPANIPADPPGGKVLHVARISDAILNGLWWFAGVKGYLDFPYVFVSVVSVVLFF